MLFIRENQKHNVANPDKLKQINISRNTLNSNNKYHNGMVTVYLGMPVLGPGQRRLIM